MPKGKKGYCKYLCVSLILCKMTGFVLIVCAAFSKYKHSHEYTQLMHSNTCPACAHLPVQSTVVLFAPFFLMLLKQLNQQNIPMATCSQVTTLCVFHHHLNAQTEEENNSGTSLLVGRNVNADPSENTVKAPLCGCMNYQQDERPTNKNAQVSKLSNAAKTTWAKKRGKTLGCCHSVCYMCSKHFVTDNSNIHRTLLGYSISLS